MRTPGASGVLEANSGKYRKPRCSLAVTPNASCLFSPNRLGALPPLPSLSPLLCPSKGAGHESLPVIKPWFLSASVTPQGLRGQAKERADERSVTGGLANVQVRGVSFPTGALFRSADRCLAGTKRVPFFLRDWRSEASGLCAGLPFPVLHFPASPAVGHEEAKQRS